MVKSSNGTAIRVSNTEILSLFESLRVRSIHAVKVVVITIECDSNTVELIRETGSSVIH